MLIQVLQLKRGDRNERDVRILAQLMLDYKFFVRMASAEPYVMLDLAR